MEIRESEQRRADNLIWNTALDYSIVPWMRVYDSEGRAELYWNSVIGAVFARYDRERLCRFTDNFGAGEERRLLETVFWLGLNSAVYDRAAAARPALSSLRDRYADSLRDVRDDERVSAVLRAYYLDVYSDSFPGLNALTEALRAVKGEDTAQVLSCLDKLLRQHLGFAPEKRKKPRTARGMFLRLFGRDEDAMNQILPVRGFALGVAEHYRPDDGESEEEHRRSIRLPRPTATKDIDMREYVTGYFGRSMYDERVMYALEKEICSGNHADCHLHFTRGAAEDKTKVKGYAGERRLASLGQEAKNRAAYERDHDRSRTAIQRLSRQIGNSILARLDISVIRSSAGRMDAGRVWRGVVLDDDRIFTREQRGEMGALAVDILLDASTSQLHRQESIAAQGYIIAESLTRCRIPVRVYSFCSMNGFTIINLFRDYAETDKNANIFRYFTAGCNRDGLAVRTAARMLRNVSAENKILVILSDCKPNDVMKVRTAGAVYREYTESEGVEDTAAEVHSARISGIHVACVFTGTDDDLPAAKRIYGRHMTRIHSLDHFSDAVSALLRSQIDEV